MLRLKQVIAERARENQSVYYGNQYEKRTSIQMDKSPDAINVQAETAKLAGVSTGTLARFEQVQRKKPELIDAIRYGEMSINQAYTELKKQEKAEQRAAKMAGVS